MTNLKHYWTLSQIEETYNLSFPEHIFRAQTVHREFHKTDEIQGSQLISSKTGGCPDDCGYCPETAHYKTGLEKGALLSVENTLAAAQNAKDSGATRFCMGAAWRDVPDDKQFDQVLEMVKGVRKLGLEA